MNLFSNRDRLWWSEGPCVRGEPCWSSERWGRLPQVQAHHRGCAGQELPDQLPWHGPDSWQDVLHGQEVAGRHLWACILYLCLNLCQIHMAGFWALNCLESSCLGFDKLRWFKSLYARCGICCTNLCNILLKRLSNNFWKISNTGDKIGSNWIRWDAHYTYLHL